MDPVTITFPGFKNLFNFKCSEKPLLSTDDILVFPLSSDKKFSRPTYSPAMTSGRASTEDINHTLSLFELALSRVSTTTDLVKSFTLRCFLPFVMLLFIQERYIRTGISDPIWFWFSIYCIVGIFYIFSDRNRQIKKSKTDLDSLIELTQPGYLKRGLRWRIPEESGWIELIKEHCDDEQLIAPVVQVHPNQANVKMNFQYEPPQNVGRDERTTNTSYPHVNYDGSK
jgi:hypothetical protein